MQLETQDPIESLGESPPLDKGVKAGEREKPVLVGEGEV